MTDLRDVVNNYEGQAYRSFQQTDGVKCTNGEMINGQGQQAMTAALFAIAHCLITLVETIENKS